MSTIYIRPQSYAPFAVDASVSVGGANWQNSAISFLVTGWLRQQEDDFDFCRYLNFKRNSTLKGGSSGSSSIFAQLSEADAYNLAAAPGSTFALSWALPRWMQFDHISIYAIYAASVPGTGDTGMFKVLPAAGSRVRGEIPGNATSALLVDGTAIARRTSVPVWRSFTELGSSGVYIPGNRLHSFDPGVTAVVTVGVSGVADASYVVSLAELKYTQDGQVTKVYLTASGAGGGGVGGYVEYDIGPFVPFPSTGADNWLPWVLTSLEHGLQLAPRRMAERDFSGRLIPQSQLNFSPYESLSFDLAYGGLSTGDGTADGRGLILLNKYAREKMPVEVIDSSGSTEYSSIYRYEGVLSSPNNPGTTQRWGTSHSWTMEIDRVQRYADERGWMKIRVCDTGTQTFTVDGNWTWLFTAGLGFKVWGDSNNDKQFSVVSSSYNAATDRTAIVVAHGIVGVVAAGYIEVWGW